VLREGQLLEEPEPEPKPTPALKLDKHTVEAGGTVHATVEGLKPNIQYKLWLKSVPAELAVVTTDAQGRAEADVTIPAGTAAGEHTVAVTDKDADSSHVLASEKLDVTQKQNPPVTPDNPADPSKPADPADPSSPEAPDKPADPSKPGKQPGNNGKPGTPARPGSQATPLHKGGTAGRHKRGQSDRSHRPSKLSQTGVGIGTTVTVLIVLVALAVIVLIVRRQQEADGSSSTGLHGKGDDSLR
ncbi:MAG: type I pullulanase, partial [Scardovia wiggsiae]|nr:type I pullulanase [Scardovia wiggsiae]